MKAKICLSLVALVSMLIVGCGGGGGSSTAAANNNSAPVIPPVLSNNTTASPTSTTSRISGKISTPSGIGISNVPITISGTSTTSVLTDREGKFTLDLANGSYTLTPMPEEYTLSPAAVSVDLSVDTVKNFTATLVNYTAVPSGSPEIIFSDCPTAEEIAAIKADLDVNFYFDPTIGQAAVCGNLTPMQKHVYSVLKYMKYARFNTALPWTDASLWDWFKGSVREVYFVDSNVSAYIAGGLYSTLGALSISAQADMGEVVFDSFVQPTGGGLYTIVALFVHEARHAQKEHTCGSKDASLSGGGAYAAQYHILKLMAENSNFALSAAQKNEILTYADFIKNTQFCVQE